jgi:hypothetical protein
MLKVGVNIMVRTEDTPEVPQPVQDDEAEALAPAAAHTFTHAAGEPERHDLWAMGWTH